MIIKSASNDRVKEIKKLVSTPKLRREKGLYVVEGIRMFREIPQGELEQVVVAEGELQSFKSEIYKKISGQSCEEMESRQQSAGIQDLNRNLDIETGTRIVVVADHIFSSLSDTVNPQGILALVRQKKYSLEDLLVSRHNVTAEQNAEYVPHEDASRPGKPLIFVLEHIQDPGNLGTMLRTAEAVGAGLMLSPDCADHYNPKVVRSTMGAIFRVPVYVSQNLSGDIDRLKERNICVYGTHLSGTEFYDNDFTVPSAFLIGNEGNGLSDAISEKADRLIRIPMMGNVESLNAATTVAVVGYEVLRQRR